MKKKLAVTPVLVLALIAVCAIAFAATQLGLLTFTSNEYQYSDEQHSADVNVPALTITPESEEGAAEKAAQVIKNINAEIAAIAEKYITDFKNGLGSDNHQDVKINYEVLNANDHYFTLRLICYTASGDSSEVDYYYTVDLSTGERVQLSDLFMAGSNYITILAE